MTMSRELRYGLVAGILTLVWMSLGYLFHWNDLPAGKYAPFFSLVVLAITNYMAILHKRDKDSKGRISFRDAFITGLSVSFMIGLLVGTFLMVYTKYINPGFVEEVLEQTRQLYQEQHKTPEQTEEALKGVRAMYSTFGQLTYGIGTTMLTGMLITLICAAVMSRRTETVSG